MNMEQNMTWDKDNLDDNESPWARKPQKSSELDDLIKESQNKIKDFKKQFGFKSGGSNGENNGKGNASKKLLFYIIGILVILWLASGFFIVQADEEAVILRFGKFDRLAYPGMNYHLPVPIETDIKEKVTIIQREEIGFRSATGQDITTPRSSKRKMSEESLMLTKDENIIDINFVVQWKINNLKQFIFDVYEPYKTVRNAAESAMRQVIGQTSFSRALTDGRSEVEDSAKNVLQKMLNEYGAGVEVVNVQLLRVDPPAEVIDAFRDVQAARADMEREINQAYAYMNSILPKAQGDAAKIKEEAIAYKQERIDRALGETRLFDEIYSQYILARDITRKRIYIETMEEVLKNVNKVIIDNKTNVLPYLPLNELRK